MGGTKETTHTVPCYGKASRLREDALSNEFMENTGLPEGRDSLSRKRREGQKEKHGKQQTCLSRMKGYRSRVGAGPLQNQIIVHRPGPRKHAQSRTPIHLPQTLRGRAERPFHQ